MTKYQQMSLFDPEKQEKATKKIIDGREYKRTKITLNEGTLTKLESYNLQDYVKDVETLGLEQTWDCICQFVLDRHKTIPSFLSITNFGELYEIGLATQDKILKKKSGQYYTPDDVAIIMSEWLKKSNGEAVCDVACGTGKLILTYLDLIGYEKARELISSGNLYLYDFDKVALKICWTALAVKYGVDIADNIHDIFCDFLDPEVKLPANCKVIANPPYAHLDEIQDYWEHTPVLMDTREFYSAFMEKLFLQSKSTVVITPFSFISSAKFFSLRKEMCEAGGGFIVAFDNVPGNIFCGRKHGIFNTNTANSVRAAITVFSKNSTIKGFRVTPLIRFKNAQRKEVLKTSVLEKLLSEEYQVVDKSNNSFKKIEKNLLEVYKDWVSKSTFILKDFTSNKETPYFIDIPNTCRYYTTASSRKLRRTGSISLYLQDEESFDLVYCLINSSFAYWWWRIFDGGITYPVGLLNELPVPANLLSKEDKSFFKEMREKMGDIESRHIVTKRNAGVTQENIRFPEHYRLQINKRLLKILGYEFTDDIFENVHANFLRIETLSNLGS